MSFVIFVVCFYIFDVVMMGFLVQQQTFNYGARQPKLAGMSSHSPAQDSLLCPRGQ